MDNAVLERVNALEIWMRINNCFIQGSKVN